MRPSKCFSATVAVMTCLGGCSGGGSGSSATTYDYAAPQLNSQRTYTRTIVDNAKNTINQTIVDTVTAVNNDGSSVVESEDPTHNFITVDGTNYSVPTEIANENNSGQETSYTETSTDGSALTCTLTPHGAGPGYPAAVGESWSSSWNVSCGNSTPIHYTQTGTIVDTESITVPAGTFTAFKLQSTISWTNAEGTTYTDSRITWRDVHSSHAVIEEQDTYVLSGTMPTNGYPATTITVLQQES